MISKTEFAIRYLGVKKENIVFTHKEFLRRMDGRRKDHFKFGEIPETTEEIPKEEKKSCVKNLFGSFETTTTKESDDELRERLFGSMKNKFVNFNGVKMIVIDEHINMTGKFLEIKDLSNNEIKYVRKVDCEIL